MIDYINELIGETVPNVPTGTKWIDYNYFPPVTRYWNGTNWVEVYVPPDPNPDPDPEPGEMVVYTRNSETVIFSGNGTQLYPLEAEVSITYESLQDKPVIGQGTVSIQGVLPIGSFNTNQVGDAVIVITDESIGLDQVKQNIVDTNQNVDTINQSVTAINQNIIEINQNITDVNQEMTEISQELTSIDQSMSALEDTVDTSIESMQESVNNLDANVTVLSSEFNDLSTATTQSLTNINSSLSAANTQLSNIQTLIPSSTTISNKLADQDFVNSSINASAARALTASPTGDPFTFKPVDGDGTLFYYKGVVTDPTDNDYIIVMPDPAYDNGTVRYGYESPVWVFRYKTQDAPFTAAQLVALNSGMTESWMDAVDTQLGTFSTHITDYTNPHQVTKAQVGLGNVNNTSDTNKPISTATQTALNAKANQSSLTSHTSNVSNPHTVTKTQVGLGNVDNTSDVNKPISTSVQNALNLKANDADVVKLTGNQVIAGVKDFGGIKVSYIQSAYGGDPILFNCMYVGGTGTTMIGANDYGQMVLTDPVTGLIPTRLLPPSGGGGGSADNIPMTDISDSSISIVLSGQANNTTCSYYGTNVGDTPYSEDLFTFIINKKDANNFSILAQDISFNELYTLTCEEGTLGEWTLLAKYDDLQEIWNALEVPYMSNISNNSLVAIIGNLSEGASAVLYGSNVTWAPTIGRYTFYVSRNSNSTFSLLALSGDNSKAYTASHNIAYADINNWVDLTETGGSGGDGTTPLVMNNWSFATIQGSVIDGQEYCWWWLNGNTVYFTGKVGFHPTANRGTFIITTSGLPGTDGNEFQFNPNLSNGYYTVETNINDGEMFLDMNNDIARNEVVLLTVSGFFPYYQ